MPNPTLLQLPRTTLSQANQTNVEDLFIVLHAHGKLTRREFARFMAARVVFRRLCDQLLINAWLRGDLDDLNRLYPDDFAQD
jgi:hypothetical protein